VAEFQSFDFNAARSVIIPGTLMLWVSAATLAALQKRPSRCLLCCLFSGMAIFHARGLPLVALLLLPLFNAGISQLGFFPRFQTYSTNLRAIDQRFRGYVWAPAVILASYALLRSLPTGFPKDLPVAAYPHIPAAARLFASDRYGGYLIYRGRTVFFDGRSDFYGAEFLRQYARIVQVRPGWRKYWDSHHFTHALLPHDAPLIEALTTAGWRTIYEDRTATLLAAAEPVP